MNVREVAREEARRQAERDLKATRRTAASEGLDPAIRIGDVYDLNVYDALRQQNPAELAGALLDSEYDIAWLEHENAVLQERVAMLRARLAPEVIREALHDLGIQASMSDAEEVARVIAARD